ncbi:glycoside hydrolase family 99-like domain-containing protein [Butyribacter intestini]|uniref:glycosyltransferase WbsX family protein n=1 Tax=Butyribacter intestini TaxID=1703332 RepID=UPI003AEF498A
MSEEKKENDLMVENNTKIIAYYLPQFHEIEENNRAWGKGFTEWDNVKKAVPLFEGHNQPREPLNDNYYNLLDIDTIQWQVNLAKKYGIYGFCFYHYWFRDGKHVLEKPAELLLGHKEVDIQFCFSWANEPWTKTWHGAAGEKEVLIEQRYGKEEQWEEHFKYLLPFFKDKRYIKIDNKPVLLIYQINKIGCFNKMIDCWNLLAEKSGFSGVYIVDMLTSDGKIARNKRVSASVDFEPGKSKRKKMIEDECLNIQDYDEACQRTLSQEHSENEWRCMFVNYDDTPRRHEKGIVYQGSTPQKFGKYLQATLVKSKNEKSRYVFINAWNEWGEGNYLEPDKKYGYEYLQAVRNALDKKYEQVVIDEKYNNVTIGSESPREAKFRRYYELYNQWLKLKNDGYKLGTFFVQNGYKKIAIYGMGEIANRLIEELEESSVDILYGIDKNMSQAFAEIDIIGMDECDRFDDVDCIVITPVHVYEKIKKDLEKKTKAIIYSIEEILNSI